MSQSRSLKMTLLLFCLMVATIIYLSAMVFQAEALSPTPPPDITPSPTPSGARLTYTANGRPSIMYSDQKPIYQLYFADAMDTPLTDDDGYYLNPAWSPDGKHLAYTFRELVNTAFYIEVMDADGTNRRRLTEDGRESTPVWSHDGTQIAFIALRETGTGIFVMNADGTDAKLLRGELDARSLDWSPDGKQFLFTSAHDAVERLYLMDADGENMHLLFPENVSAEYSGVWSPDGSRIAYISDNQIFLTPGEGQPGEKLALNGWVVDSLETFNITDLAWSPDGKQIAFIAYSRELQMMVSTPVPLDRVGPQLMIVDVATGATNLITYGFNNANPDWKPAPIG
jgi:TolB protein